LTPTGLIVALAAILIAAYLFTNAVEILGDRLGLSQGGVGSVLAAVGTALPETMIPIVAILGAVFAGRDPESAGEIGIGAILGAPFMLATLAMFVVGRPSWDTGAGGKPGPRWTWTTRSSHGTLASSSSPSRWPRGSGS